VVWTDHFKKFLKMIFGRLSLLLEVSFGSRYTVLVGVAGFLITTFVPGCYGDVMGSSL
jgi:hypothetical protein